MMNAAEVLALHRKSWTVQSGVATCTAPGCDWGKFGTLTQTNEPFAQHQLNALKAAGYAVVELPNPDEFGEWSIDGEDDFGVSPIPLMELESGDMQMGCQIAWGEVVLNLSAEVTRQLSAALLAAADSADIAGAQS